MEQINRTGEAAEEGHLSPYFFTLHSYFLIGLAAVVVCVAAFFIFSGGDDKPQDSKFRSTPTPKPYTSPRTPAPAPKAAAPKKIARPKTVDEALANVGEMQKPVIKVRPITPEEMARLTNRTFKTGTEQLMSWVFSTELGEIPVPIPNIGEEDRKNIVSILLSKNEITDSDSEMTAICKENVDLAKKEMLKYLKEGGDPDEFLQYYRQQLMKSYEYRNQVKDQVEEIIESGDLDLAREFVAKVNEKLDEEGIKKISIHEFNGLANESDNNEKEGE